MLLPIKTKDGIQQRFTEIVEKPAEDGNCSYNDLCKLGTYVHDWQTTSDVDAEKMEVNRDEDKRQDNQVSWLGNIYDGSNIEISEPVSVAKIYAKRDEAIQKYKFRIGLLSSGFLENPELKVMTYPSCVS